MPLRPALVAPVDQSKVPASPGQVTAGILVVEDNPGNQLVVKRMLEGLGCNVTFAADGSSALQAFTDDSFDAVLMDCHLPQMDGYEVTRRIRQGELGQSPTPIITLTATSSASHRSESQRAGMDDFLENPVLPEHLQEILARRVGCSELYSSPSPNVAERKPPTRAAAT